MTPTYKKVMVTLDGSDTANQALTHAEFLATKFDAELSLFRVVPEIQSLGDVDGEESAQTRQLNEAEEDLNSQAEILKHHVNINMATDVGEPAERIVDYAKKHEIDLIVMTTHGRSGLSRMIYGSVAEQVLHTAPCAILLVRSSV